MQVATGRNEQALEELKAEGCKIVVADLTQNGECERVVKEAIKQMGGVTTLVHCAGVLKGASFGTPDCNLKNFQHNFLGNTQPTFEMMEHAIPYLKDVGASGGASILNVSSVNGLQSFAGLGAYCASKAAVDMLTRCAAVDLAPFGIRVNAVNPVCRRAQLFVWA